MQSNPHRAGPPRASSAPVRIAAIYAVLGLLWVFLSDALLAGETPSFSSWQTLKGSLYVLATTVLLYLLIRRDIRRIHVSEEALAESELRYRTLVEMSPNPIVVHADGRLLFANQQTAHLLGAASGADLVGRRSADLLSPEDVTLVEQRANDAVHLGKASPPHEYTVTGAHGRRVLEVTTTPFRFEGRPAAMSIAHDVTEQREAVEQLRSEHRLMASLMDTSPAGIVMIDRSGHITFANARAEEVLGVTRQRMTSRTFSAVEWGITDVDGRAMDPADLPFRRVLESGKAVQGAEHAIIRPGGQRILVSVNAAPLVNDVGDIVSVVATVADVTDRVRTEADLRESQRTLATLVSNLPGMVYRRLPGPEWTLEYVSEGCDAITGCTASDLQFNRRASYVELIHPEDRRRVAEEIGAALEQSRSYDVTYRLIPADGVQKWVWDCGRAVRAAEQGGNIVEGFVSDITARVRAEEELRESQETLRLVFERATDGINIAEYDPATSTRRLVQCNDRYVEMSGFTRQELFASKNLNELVSYPHPVEVRRQWARWIEAGTAFHGLSSWHRPDGKENWCEWTATPIRRGNRLLIFGIDRDVTGRRKADHALQRRLEAERLIAAISQRFINLASNELDRGIDQALGSLGQFAGADRSYVFQVFDGGRTLSNTHEWCAEGIRSVLHTMQGVPTAQFSWWMTRLLSQEGVFLPRVSDLPPEAAEVKKILDQQDVKSLVTVPMFAGGRFVGFVGFDFVRSEKQWRDEDLSLLQTFAGIVSSAMERRQAEHERDRLEQQLLQAQKLEAIGTLAGGVAHDFNNLLTGIIGYANLLQSEAPTGSEVHESAQAIESAARRGGQLTGQLLAFARKRRRENVPVDLHEAIGDASSLLRRTLGENIVIHEDFAAEASVVCGDPAALQQVILNLAVNARDAMPDGGQIRISTRSVDLRENDPLLREGLAPGQYCEIVVSDTGTGISLEIRDRIFEPFFTTKDLGKGTGMGLATVYGTVRDHGGSVDVQSQVGQGSSFRIYLPVAVGGTVCVAEDDRAEPIRGSGRILVVDDEEIVRQALTGMLEKLGYQVVALGDGEQAIGYFREHGGDLDLVIVDMVMPAMSGIECFRALQAIHPQVRVLLSTGYGLTDEAEELLAAHQVGVAEKPFGLLRLSQAVAEALEGRPRS